MKWANIEESKLLIRLSSGKIDGVIGPDHKIRLTRKKEKSTRYRKRKWKGVKGKSASIVSIKNLMKKILALKFLQSNEVLKFTYKFLWFKWTISLTVYNSGSQTFVDSQPIDGSTKFEQRNSSCKIFVKEFVYKFVKIALVIGQFWV